uniref:Uncharacterized protein n=1 Tax=Candidatus Kentrum sp. TUN TaxID=2126343 RepID=A0A450ZVF0_9GAMM|nr:MAG: hypothetical protein BECKTUN1418F_GA0071002_11252 [Candidatus Kentron sp. TUN]VFK66262.1 MAG: hypothetical protein BECKTUN1418E_GA0071001_11207 [Candidatus Kentron sp. TUN]
MQFFCWGERSEPQHPRQNHPHSGDIGIGERRGLLDPGQRGDIGPPPTDGLPGDSENPAGWVRIRLTDLSLSNRKKTEDTFPE